MGFAPRHRQQSMILVERDTPDPRVERAMHVLGYDQFLILPHAEVATYHAAWATNTDHWLTPMNRLQQRIGAAAVQDRGEDPA